jgi:hypothetical protein
MASAHLFIEALEEIDCEEKKKEAHCFLVGG